MVLPGQLQGATILQVIPDLAAGGAERTTIEVAEAIVKAGGRALVASAGGRLEGELAMAGGELFRNQSLTSKNPFTIHRNAGWLAKLITAEGVDIVHARSRAPAWSAYWASKRTSAQYVTTYHGAYNAKSAAKRWYNSIMARGEVVIANSDYIAAHIAQTYPDAASRIVTIPRGVDLDVMDPQAVTDARKAALKQSWFPDGTPTGPICILPGRLTRWKGQLDAIEAFGVCKQRGADPLGALVLVGDAQGRTEYVDELKSKISELKLDDTVRIVGHCADMSAAYLISDIVLAPSREPEAFGRVAAEAAAMGRRVVAAAHGGQMEIIVDQTTGLLVAPKDAAAIANALTELFAQSDAARDRMEQAAMTHARARFSKQALQTATLQVYETVLGRVE